MVAKKKPSYATILKAAEKGDGTGYCKACWTKVKGVEPDARGYVCPKCGAAKVFGAEELLF